MYTWKNKNTSYLLLVFVGLEDDHYLSCLWHSANFYDILSRSKYIKKWSIIKNENFLIGYNDGNFFLYSHYIFWHSDIRFFTLLNLIWSTFNIWQWRREWLASGRENLLFFKKMSSSELLLVLKMNMSEFLAFFLGFILYLEFSKFLNVLLLTVNAIW